MSERRIDDLFTYLDLLCRLQVDDYYLCTKEIRECIDSIRRELSLTDD